MAETEEMTAIEAALALGISRERVIRRIETGKLPGRRDAARGWLVNRDAVEAARTDVAA